MVLRTYGRVIDLLRSVQRLLGLGCNAERFTVAVEGNIGSGKTNMLRYFESNPFCETWTEPVNKWRDVQGHNALAMMYLDPHRWSLTFQTYVQLTMLQTHTQKQFKPVKLMERSIYSAKYCFVENLHKGGVMPDMEYIVLTEWFDWICRTQDVHLDLIVYLRTTPETCLERIRNRGRKEEKPIPIDYLKKLHDLHEEWLIRNKQYIPAPVLILDANADAATMQQEFEVHKRRIMCGVYHDD
ncbi:thymidine kinase 2, mitochondrial-like [Lineus longissimus]|uniref:thymidine kinase 2, mitochondrial-like n=1 Tax=Lineus longissimus TaxID=88925 RepID=UPI002B4F9E4A